MLAYRNPSNEDSDNIFRYTLKLNAYVTVSYEDTDDYICITDIAAAKFDYVDQGDRLGEGTANHSEGQMQPSV